MAKEIKETKPKKRKWDTSYNKRIYKSRMGFYSFEEAKEKIQQTHVMSVCDYIRWHDLNKPSRMPKRPDRAYRNHGFTTWSDFLGTHNEFKGIIGERGNYLPYEQAKEYIHSLGLNSYEDLRQELMM